MSPAPVIKDAAGARLETCRLCDQDFRRVDGIHVGSLRRGMIPNTPCDRVFVIHGGTMTDDNTRPWMAHVDGDVVRKKSGDARRFASAEAAYAVARKTAPQRWHP